ncbi:hypothetical protein AJ80_05510 [Polytolypa hystricis UAMH7299]|uniref:Terpene cyclase/mutase family member n=1 Tax=Polytolypa hystricis (strain UAMH7299) TaxID=1447883 RepID=A0A2B7Y384_POLH7|nr:hypothetical protein AJ80_05510 [Polytolypa hystricis UAMH7299]
MANSGTTSVDGFTLKIKNRLNAKPGNDSGQNHSSDAWPFSSRRTDPEGWRLVVEDPPGRLKWKYLNTDRERDSQPQDPTTKFFLGLPTSAPDFVAAKRPSQAVFNGARFQSRFQVRELGCWAADLSCILFVTPMLIFSWYITGADIDEAHAIELVNYLFDCQDPEDGGWPTYMRQKTTLMGTILIYVALRLMGVPPGDEHMLRARACFLRMGGAAYVPCWAKFWLALLGLWEWEGTDPYPVEMWLMPDWIPINPWRWYSITSQAYLHMCYLSARRFTFPSNPLLDEIRTEIYGELYSSLNFTSLRGEVLMCDRHQPKSRVLDILNWTLVNVWYPWLRPKALAKKGEKRVWEIIEHSNKAYNSAGFVSIDTFLSMISFYCKEGRDSKKLKQIQGNSVEYLWMGRSGMQSMSVHGGHTWETSFAVQTLVHTGLADHPELRSSTTRAYEYLVRQQYLEDWADSPFCNRFSRLGGWPFTTRYSGVTCVDCTGEALKAILMVEGQTDIPRITEENNICLAVDNLLLFQNASGGYGSFEPIRSNTFTEYLNGTEVFGRVMIEYDYVECASSCITALALFRTQHNYRSDEVNRAIDRGVQFIHQRQRIDGSWLAYWGIACTYAAFFAMEALSCAGETYDNHPVVKRGCDFLLGNQMEDGGWGETIDSIISGTYTPAEKSHTVQTAWCCLALMSAAYPDPEPIRRGIKLIMSRQKSNGEWKQEAAVGSGIITCQIQYHNYIYSFPIRAISMYMQKYGDNPLLT